MDSLKPALTDLLGKHISSFDECSATADAILKLIEPRGESELREALEKIISIEHAEDDLDDEYGFSNCQAYGYNEGLTECQDIARQALASRDAWRPEE
jgi:hypothetical protein